jgi:hypothetical protein
MNLAPGSTKDAYYIGLLTALVVLLQTLSGCSGVQARNPLVQQIIRMRPGHVGLTHQVCAERNWLGACQRMDVVEYRLDDEATRSKLVALGFRCRIAGWRYKIDPDAPAFVRYQRITEGSWLNKRERTVKVNRVDFAETQFLIDSATVCYSEQFYPDGISE